MTKGSCTSSLKSLCLIRSIALVWQLFHRRPDSSYKRSFPTLKTKENWNYQQIKLKKDLLREGAEKEKLQLEKTLKILGFEIEPDCDDLKKEDVMKKLETSK